MSDVVLVQAQPRNSTTGALVDVRLAGGGSRPYDQLGFSDWRGGLASLPRFATSIGFERSGWNGAALPQTGALRFFPAGDPDLVAELAGMNWDGARVIVSLGDDEVGPSSYRRVFVGTSTACTARGGAIQVTLSDLSKDLDKPAAPDTFAGTGGLEGGDDATGRVKRRTFGYAFNIEGRLLDKAANVFEFGDPARPFRAFRLVKDKGLAASSVITVDWQGSALATLNALRAASAPQGGAAVAPSIACVKWWTMPGGPLTADIEGESTSGYVSTAATIAARIVSIYAPNIAVLNTAEADGWKPATVGVHVEEGNETAASVLDRLLLPVGLVWTMGADGVLAFRRFTWDAPVETVRAETIERVATYGPLRTRRLGFQRNHRQHTDAEINATVLLATDATYADGTPIEVLKPAQAAADVTGRNTASAIVGQGPGATAAQKDIFNSFLSISAGGLLSGGGGGQVTYPGIGGKALGLLDQLFFGSPYLMESAGGPTAGLNAFKTILGISSGFSGQGALATLSSILYGSDRLTGLPRAISPSAFFPSGFMYASEIYGNDGNRNLDTYFPVTTGSDKTSGATAAAFAGQGALATRNNVDLGTDQIINRFASFLFYDNAPGITIQALRPQEGGANITENRTSAAITGQGPGATAIGSDVLNNRELSDQTSIPLPGGATYSSGESLVTGAFKITLPVRASFTMMRFYVDLFNYNTGETTTYLIAGYNYDGGGGAVAWYNVSANVIGSSARALPVRFGDDGTKACVYIGNTSTTWNYPKVVVRDWLGGHQGFQASVWKSGWSVGLASFIQGQSASVDQPVAGDAAFGLNTRESFGGLIATTTNFKTILGTASAFTGQGSLATQNQARYGDQIANLPAAIQPAGFFDSGRLLYASRVVYDDAGLVSSYRPQEAGSNKTETRTASAIAGQGGLATVNQITTNNQLGGYVGTRLAAHPLNDNFLGSSSIAYLNGTGMEPLKPQEGGANVTENRTSASITGQGPGATASASKVLNNSTDGNVLRIPAPVGGAFGTTANSLTGPIRITLPQGFISTMMKFEVEVYNYQDRASGTYTIGGYSYSEGYWVNISAQYVGSDQYRRNVRFASENGKVVIYIGELNTVWNYPQIRVINFQAGYSAYVEDYYATGWSIAINNAAFQNVNDMITPHAGESKFGLNLLESTGVPATIPAFKTNQGTAAGIAGQGSLATVNQITSNGQLGGNVGARLAGHPLNDTYLSANTIAYAQGAGLEPLKPQEGGANVTENRTSAAIVGQSGFATAVGINRDQVFAAGFFNYNAFSLGYTVTRSDGVSTVTEQLVVTQVGVAAGFAGQGALASKNNAGYNELDVATLTAQTSDAADGMFAANYDVPLYYAPVGKDMAVKPGGTIYVSFSGVSGTVNSANPAVYNSIEILDAANNAVLASVRLPYGAQGAPRLENYLVMIPNAWGYRTIRWRIASRGSQANPGSYSYTQNIAVTVQWKAL